MTTITIEKKSILFQQKLLEVSQTVLASCFIGICAQIKIPLYFTPVPLTVQTSAIMLVSVFLGSRKGALATLCYLLQGCLGLPVWAGGASGFLHFLGPTGGYLMAYLVQAYLIGWFLERHRRANLLKIIGILSASICLQMSLGSLWLAQFVGVKRCFALGFYPFVTSEMARALLIAFYIKFRKK